MMREEPRHLFVYGTLMRCSRSPYAKSCKLVRDSWARQPCRPALSSWALPGAIFDASRNARVHGEVSRLNGASVLDALDAYEGCRPEDPEPRLFRRAPSRSGLSAASDLLWAYPYAGAVAAALSSRPAGSFCVNNRTCPFWAASLAQGSSCYSHIREQFRRMHGLGEAIVGVGTFIGGAGWAVPVARGGMMPLESASGCLLGRRNCSWRRASSSWPAFGESLMLRRKRSTRPRAVFLRAAEWTPSSSVGGPPPAPFCYLPVERGAMTRAGASVQKKKAHLFAEKDERTPTSGAS